jgi:hypothetical protein
MKFLQVYCEKRESTVFINIEKIVLIEKIIPEVNDTEASCIEVEGLNDGKGGVEVRTPAEELIKMINGEDRMTVGFKTTR